MKKFVIDEAFLQQVESMQTILKQNVSGLFGGNRKSRNFGSSCEFADYRDYGRGDDVSKIDWNAYARFERLYLKLYLDERQMHTKIYIDASRSMDFGEGGKAEQAIRLAAAIAYISICEMDRVSVYVICEGKVSEVIPAIVGKDAYFSSIAALNDVTFVGDSHISKAILPTNVGYGDGLSILISDFLTDNNYEDAIDLFTDKKRDVLCVQILSSEELNPQTRGKVHLFDSENDTLQYRKNVDREIARAYRAALEYATARIEQYCKARGGNYLLLNAETPVTRVILEQMVDREVLR